MEGKQEVSGVVLAFKMHPCCVGIKRPAPVRNISKQHTAKCNKNLKRGTLCVLGGGHEHVLPAGSAGIPMGSLSAQGGWRRHCQPPSYAPTRTLLSCHSEPHSWLPPPPPAKSPSLGFFGEILRKNLTSLYIYRWTQRKDTAPMVPSACLLKSQLRPESSPPPLPRHS